jgi:hypothetical protein
MANSFDQPTIGVLGRRSRKVRDTPSVTAIERGPAALAGLDWWWIE